MLETRQAQLCIELPAQLRSAGRARHLMTTALAEDVDEACLDIVVLLTSELVTNAVLHARSPVSLRMWATPARVRVEAHDHSLALPAVQHLPATTAHGRGMRMLDHLATRWGVQRDPGGKCVWFELATDTDPTAAALAFILDGADLR